MLTDEGNDANADQGLPLVLLPGTLCDARVFGPLQDRLPGVQARVLLCVNASTLQEAARQVLAEAPERFVLLGFSLGGMVAIETALSAPDRVRGLALISTTPLPVSPERHRARREAVQESQRLGLARVVRERLWPQYRGAIEHPETLLLLESMAESLGHLVYARQTEMALRREDFRPRLPAITCPTLVVSGTGDKISPPGTQDELEAGLRNCTRVSLEEAGHIAVLERPDEVAAAVAAWFHTVERNEARQ